MMTMMQQERLQAITLLQAGHTVEEVARQLQRTPQWVRKWRRRFKEQGYAGLQEQSRRPHTCANELAQSTREAIITVRMSLEAEACQTGRLKYIGAQAIRTRLKAAGCTSLPSVPTIERILRQACLTKQTVERMEPKVNYPRLHPQAPHELIQVDIVPHYLTGGEKIACFNAIDTVSRYATGQAKAQRRAQDAVGFLRHVYKTVGIPKYTQVDNEGCFSGGTTHPHVLGQVLRLALAVGTELLFSPTYHPQSNGYVERFHQDYNQHVWQDTYLDGLADVNEKGELFLTQIRHSRHHQALAGQSPHESHWANPPTLLPANDSLADTSKKLFAGKCHFMRKVQADKTVRVLNVSWGADAPADSGVWVTLELTPEASWLRIYDKAPDQPDRRCLNNYPFPVKEKVYPRLQTLANTSESPPITQEHPSSVVATVIQPPEPVIDAARQKSSAKASQPVEPSTLHQPVQDRSVITASQPTLWQALGTVADELFTHSVQFVFTSFVAACGGSSSTPNETMS